MASSPPTLLCVANFPSDTGYAWDFFGTLYAGVADRLADRKIRTLVAYPALPAPPRSLRGSSATAVELDVALTSGSAIRKTLQFVRRENVRVVYFTDRAVWNPRYLLLRLAGVRRIVVYDQTSGSRTRPRGLKRVAKWAAARIPGTVADRVLAVSEYVARRHSEVGLIPRRRIRTLWNGITIPELDPTAAERLHDIFGLRADRPLLACACRATPQKGVHHLLRAFDRLVRREDVRRLAPALIYIGAGPQFEELAALRESLPARDDIILAGYRSDAISIVAGANIAVVPSVWQEGFGLAALEPMAYGRPVIASATGALPEIVQDEVTGLLFPAGDEDRLEEAMYRLLSNPEMANRMGQAGRQRATEHFSLERQLCELASLVAEPFDS